MAMVAAADHSAAVSRPVNGGGVDRVHVLRIWVMLTLQYCGFGLAWGKSDLNPDALARRGRQGGEVRAARCKKSPCRRSNAGTTATKLDRLSPFLTGMARDRKSTRLNSS